MKISLNTPAVSGSAVFFFTFPPSSFLYALKTNTLPHATRWGICSVTNFATWFSPASGVRRMLGVHGPMEAVIPTSLCSVSLQLGPPPPTHTHTVSSQMSCCFNRHATFRQHHQYLYIPSMCSAEGLIPSFGT